MDEVVSKLLADLLKAAPGVRKQFGDLFDPSLATIPIPFFGDLLNAKVVTIGVNPSDGEIRDNRWPQQIDVPTLYNRLIQYFNNPRVRPHSWFETWEQALREIGVSYKNGSVVHIDIFPWATRPISKLPTERCLTMATESLPSFWQSMLSVSNLQLILMAGTITNRYYLHEFLAKSIFPKDISLNGAIPRGRDGFVGYLQLRLANKQIPVFFCSISPSAINNRYKLPERVRENQDQLRNILS